MNLLKGFGKAVLSNKKVTETLAPMLRTTPSVGNILLLDEGAKAMGIAEKDNVVIAEFPEALGEQKIAYPHHSAHVVDGEVKGAIEYLVIYKGYEGNDTNPGVGNICRAQGAGFMFSSKAPWVALGGEEAGEETTTNHFFQLKTEFLGIAANGELVTADNVDSFAGQVVVYVNAESEFAQTESMDEVKEGTKLFLLEYNSSKTSKKKAPKGSKTIKVEGTEEGTGTPSVEGFDEFGA